MIVGSQSLQKLDLKKVQKQPQLVSKLDNVIMKIDAAEGAERRMLVNTATAATSYVAIDRRRPRRFRGLQVFEERMRIARSWCGQWMERCCCSFGLRNPYTGNIQNFKTSKEKSHQVSSLPPNHTPNHTPGMVRVNDLQGEMKREP